MSVFALIILIAGLSIILIYFKKKIDSTKRLIEIGTIPDSTFKLPIVRKAEKELEVNYISRGLAVTNYLISVLNYQFNFVEAWVVLAIMGLSLSYATYISEITPSHIFESDSSAEEKLVFERKKAEAKKFSTFILVGSLALSGNWAYQVIKNEAEAREVGISEALSLTGSGWCSNFADIKVYGGGTDVVKSGGWPCINIASVDDFSFSKVGKDNKMCIRVSLDRDEGLPGQEVTQNSYKSFQVCALDTWYSSWSESTFSDEIYDQVKPELDSLQLSLCRIYGFRMGESNYSTYCRI
jgi:hypothetical protein